MSDKDDKDDIFDMEFGEEQSLPPPSSPKLYGLHRGRSTSLSVTLHHSKALMQAKEQEAKEFQHIEMRRTAVVYEDRPQDDYFGNGKDEDEKPEETQEPAATGSSFQPTRNYNNVKMKYFQALNISKKTAPMEAVPRQDPNEIFSKPILSAPTSAPIPIAADHRFFYELSQTDTFVPPHEMAQLGKGKSTVAFLDRPRKKTFHAAI